jgi:hypothetical protein
MRMVGRFNFQKALTDEVVLRIKKAPPSGRDPATR